MIELLLGIAVFMIVYFLVTREKAKINMYVPQVYTDLNSIEQELVRLINQHRIALGLQPLLVEELASNVCDIVVDEHLENGTDVSHYNAFERIKDARASYGGEICGQGFNTALGFFNKYIESSEHRHAIENPIYDWVGISIKERKNYCLFTTY